MARLTSRRLLLVGGVASLVPQVVAPWLVDIDGWLPWGALAVGILGSVILVLLAGAGITTTEALILRTGFHSSEVREHRKWIGWFESQRSAHGAMLADHDKRLVRLEEKIDELLARTPPLARERPGV